MTRIALVSAALLIVSLLSCPPVASAEVSLSSAFGDHMVLQRDLPVTVWGKATPGMPVTVRFAGQNKSSVADESGRWMIRLDPMPASKDGRVLEVIGGRSCQDVLVGEVWHCSGQSNMGTGVVQSTGGKEAVQAANLPLIRLTATPRGDSPQPLDEVPMQWHVCTPQTANWYSAVAFYFARKLHQELNVPIGLINTSHAGSGIEPYIPLEAMAAEPGLSRLATGRNVALRYNARVYPLVPITLRGVLWYQGESNLFDEQYGLKLRTLITSWRRNWGYDFPFLIVQLAGWPADNLPRHAPPVGAAVCREQQLRTLSLPGTGMIVSIDLGEKNLHPANKLDFGLRLANLALHDVYSRDDLVASGPIYQSHAIDADRVVVQFTHTDGGLMVGRKVSTAPVEEVRDGTPKEFQIAGDDRVWHDATVVIEGDKIVVWSPEVSRPAAVRYAFSQCPEQPNLYNRAGLPASPFRTDDWPLKP